LITPKIYFFGATYNLQDLCHDKRLTTVIRENNKKVSKVELTQLLFVFIKADGMGIANIRAWKFKF